MPAVNYPVNITFRQGVKLVLISLILIIAILTRGTAIYAEDCDKISDLDKKAGCLAEKKEKKEKEYSSVSSKLAEIRKKTEEVSGQINSLASQISITQAEVDKLQAEINTLEAEIKEINDNLSDRKSTLSLKEELRNTAIRNLAKKEMGNSWEKFVQASNGVWNSKYSAIDFVLDRAISQNTLGWIKVLNKEIVAFEADKKEALDLKAKIAQEQQNMLAVKAQLDNQRFSAEAKKDELKDKEEEKTSELLSLQEEIARLSEAQQAVLRMKSGEDNVSGYEAPSYKLPDPPFSPAFAAMSYGAFTHYKGMSQYGAKGRAEDGKSYKDILKFYYQTDVKEKDDFPGEICVEGHGDMDFQEYLYGLAEMPSDWPSEALKAQAIAGRSYAYRFVKSGKCICTTESCQVFSKSKSDNPPDKWKDAVDDTEDKILAGDVVAYYSSTTGGYVEPAGWDLDGDSWPSDAYEKKADSPWFYRAWYTQTYNNNSSTCGRDTPWLKEKEMADILNAWVVWRKGSDSEKKRVSPVTTSCWGGDPYSLDDMKEKAEKYGGAYTDISGVREPTFNSGKTTEICFDTNRGTKCLGGEEFKTVFNLRAPGYVAIRSRLFDIEMED